MPDKDTSLALWKPKLMAMLSGQTLVNPEQVLPAAKTTDNQVLISNVQSGICVQRPIHNQNT